MKITETEMRGLITGKAMPADIFVGESLAAYLVRKFTNLHTERDALAVENASIKANVAVHAAGFSVCPVCSHEEPCETDDIVWMVKVTPATDTYLNSVRADGVKEFAHQQRVIADALTRREEQRSHRITACRAEEFAAQLRAGEQL